ncbi:hypothetical protein [Lewinella sp. IMCC34191]|uniref:hypothetical protein n=1 Tax=Lewinella sp. IMCC34191 TaxID=2259172 RepID=UPI000E24EF9E|nr:hypothetical protein [Lewinella sp. IMCC34191]
MRATRPLLLLAVSAGLSLGLLRCSTTNEPTQGVVTTVREVQPEEYKIADEQPVANVADSRVIVNRLTGTSDTFTLDEVKAIQQTEPDSSRTRRPFRSAGMGYWGFIMLNRMGRTPSASAYTNQSAYQRATNTTGSSLARTSRARSGFGRSSGSSTRSFGG